MVNNKHETQQNSGSQRSDLGIETVLPGTTLNISSEQYPWLSDDHAVDTVQVTLETGESFLYGSIVSGNKTLTKIADDVPAIESHKAEIGLFKAIPDLIRGKYPPNIDYIPGASSEKPLLKVAKRGNDAARLVFVREEHDGRPVFLKVAVSSHKVQSQMNGIITKTKHGKRRKHDG